MASLIVKVIFSKAINKERYHQLALCMLLKPEAIAKNESHDIAASAAFVSCETYTATHVFITSSLN